MNCIPFSSNFVFIIWGSDKKPVPYEPTPGIYAALDASLITYTFSKPDVLFN